MIPLNASDRWYIITLLSLFHSTPLSTPSTTLSLLFSPLPSRCIFLSLKQTVFPGTGHNLLSVFYSFHSSSSFLIVDVVLRHWITFSWGWMYPQFVMMKWMTRGTISGNELQNGEPKVTDQPRVKAVFPSLQPAVHSVRRHVHHLPQQTHLRSIDLTHEAFQWKMIVMIQYIRIWMLN